MNTVERTSRSHYKLYNGNLVPKKGFATEQEALRAARYCNSCEKSIHKMIVYKCIKCNQWHIGHNGKLLTDKDRENALKKLTNRY